MPLGLKIVLWIASWMAIALAVAIGVLALMRWYKPDGDMPRGEW